jgi:hypothetical protein
MCLTGGWYCFVFLLVRVSSIWTNVCIRVVLTSNLSRSHIFMDERLDHMHSLWKGGKAWI